MGIKSLECPEHFISLALPTIDFALIKDDSAVFQLPEMINSEAEVIETKFRTADDLAILLDTRAQNASDRILLMLSNGELSLRLHFGGGSKHVSHTLRAQIFQFL